MADWVVVLMLAVWAGLAGWLFLVVMNEPPPE
jgi:hypothetical protein